MGYFGTTVSVGLIHAPTYDVWIYISGHSIRKSIHVIRHTVTVPLQPTYRSWYQKIYTRTIATNIRHTGSMLNYYVNAQAIAPLFEQKSRSYSTIIL